MVSVRRKSKRSPLLPGVGRVGSMVLMRQGPNVGLVERIVSAAMAGLLTDVAVRRRGLLRLLAGPAAANLLIRGLSGHCWGYERLGVTGEDADRMSHPLVRDIHLHKTLTVLRGPEELYAFWRDRSNLPRIMDMVESVEVLDSERSRWTAMLPFLGRVTWQSRIVEDVPNERISWQAEGDGPFQESGTISFTSAGRGRGTAVSVDVAYRLPGGALTAAAGKVAGCDPESCLSRMLYAFRQYMETGEISARLWGRPREDGR